MSLRTGHVEINGFTGGLNTEASVLNAQPTELMNGSVNVELTSSGSLRRRKGADFFSSIAPTTVRSGAESAESVRESPSGFVAAISAPNGEVLRRVIIDLDNKFYIYTEAASALGDFANPLQIVDKGVNSHAQQKFYTTQFAQSSDKVFFTGRYTQPGYLEIDDDNSTFNIIYIDVNTRESATELADRVKVGAFTGGTRYPLSPYDGAEFRDSDVKGMITYKDTWYESVKQHNSDSDSEPGVGANWQRYWKLKKGTIPGSVASWASGTGYNSTGILKKYDKSIAADVSITYPTAIAFFQGRLWLGGDPQEPNRVYFSQVIIENEDIEKFHTENDPFDPTDPNVVADDGGTIDLRGAGAVVQLVEAGGTLWAGTTTSVQGITGADNVFSAINFAVATLINEGVNSPHAMVRVEDALYIFGEHNIWFSTVTGTSIFAKRSTVSISDGKLQSLYGGIPFNNKASAKVLYTRNDKKLYYFYNAVWTDFDSATNSYVQPGYYTDCLILDMSFQYDASIGRQQGTDQGDVKGAFYTYSFADTALNSVPYIALPFATRAAIEVEDFVVDDAGNSVTDDIDVLITSADGNVSKEGIGFLLLERDTLASVTTTNAVFGKLTSINMQDWSANPAYTVSYSSTAITGVQTADNAAAKKNAPYLFFVMKPTELGVASPTGEDINEGGCFLRTAWDFATGVNNPKYSAQTQIYAANRYGSSGPDVNDDAFDAVWYKHRVRGRGHALQLIFENDGDKDFEIAGWGQTFYGKK